MHGQSRGRARGQALAIGAVALVVATTGCTVVDRSAGPGSGSDQASSSTVTVPSALAPPSLTSVPTTPTTPITPSTPSTPNTPNTPNSSGTPEPRQVTVVMNGDMLLHEGLWAAARTFATHTGRGGPDGMDFRPVLADLRRVVSGADLAICHLETPLAPPRGPYAGYPLFSAPSAIVPALAWEGYDACTTASNHSLDQGLSGLRRTLHDLDAAGLAHAGTAATRRAAERPLLLHAAGVTVALVAATYGTNGLPIPPHQPWSVPLIDVHHIERMAHRAKQEGADVVLVALHWGAEYQHAPTPDQQAVADELTRSPDIDFVYGHHAHVVQPYQRLHGTWVAYGLGNAIAQQDPTVEGVYDGDTCRVTFTERADGSFRVSRLEYIPTTVTRFDGVHPMRWIDVRRHLHDPRYAALRPELRATQQRVRTVIGSLGALRLGVTEGR